MVRCPDGIYYHKLSFCCKNLGNCSGCRDKFKVGDRLFFNVNTQVKVIEFTRKVSNCLGFLILDNVWTLRRKFLWTQY